MRAPPSSRPHLLAAAGLALASGMLCGSAEPACAQNEITFEMGASRIGPPLGVEGSAARFALVGVRASSYTASGSGGFGSLLVGQTLDETAGGSFLSGMVEGSLTDRWSPSWSGSLQARALGYGTRSPYPYRAWAVEGGPSVRLRTARFGVEVDGVFGAGRSRFEIERPDLGISRAFESELWRYGSTAEVTVGPLAHNVGVAAGWHRTPAGDYASLGGRVAFAGRWGVAELRVDRWETPTATETSGGLAFVLALGNVWSLRGFLGRTDPDPLTLAQPGSGSGGALLGANLLPVNEVSPRGPALFEVLGTDVEAGSVRLRVTPPEAEAVSVLGDFTLWEPVAMNRDGDDWIVELRIPVGTHHFGFLLNDDEWYVPDDAPDVAPDEWGRLTATLVIEGATP